MSITRKNKNQSNMKIRIKRRYRYFKVKNIVMILCLVTISLMSGAIGTEFIIDKYLSNPSSEQSKDTSYNDVSNKNEYSSVLDNVSKSVVTISNDITKLSSNNYDKDNITGVVVDSNGYILTNLSKIKSYDKIFVKLSSKASPVAEAHIVGKDIISDVAILKISNENLTPIEFAEKSDIKNGDNVIIAGDAISSDYIGICTNGIITSINDKVVHENSIYSLIQTNAIINEFNDAGPICNMEGKLVGFASDSLSKQYNKQGLYYGISVINIKNLVQNSISLESIIGMTGKEIDIEESKNGLYVETLVPNGYAAKAGIKSSDILTEIDGKDIKSNEDIYGAIKDKKSGDTAVCDILRNGKEIKLTIHFDKQ